MKLIIDSHLDLAWNALSWKRDITRPIDEINRGEAGMTDLLGRAHATTSLPELRRGGFAVVLGTMMARVPHGEKPGVHAASLDFPAHAIAHAFAQSQLVYYRMLETEGEVTLLRTAGELDAHWRRWALEPENRGTLPVGIIVAMEGSDAIVEPGQAGSWFDDGLRCVSLVHYGCSAYAAGTGEEGPLTEKGRTLLDAIDQLGMILDLTHLSDMSFFEALDRFRGPVLASHQNCRSLVPGQRQFSDEQIRLIIERGGILGTAFDAWMLYPGWVRGKTPGETTPREVVGIEAAADHIDHVCQLAGNCRHAAIGTDLDGGYGTEQTPTGLDTIADVQKLDAILSTRGYREEDIAAILHGNWLGFFRRNLPA